METLDYLKRKNLEFKVINLREIPKTAKDVERIYGCTLHQVLKTLIFIGEIEPIIIVLPGDKKVNLERLKIATGQSSLRMAKPEEVKKITGCTIGEVSPFGIERNIKKIIDESVFKIIIVNIGSGKAGIGIEISSNELKKAENWIIRDIAE